MKGAILDLDGTVYRGDKLLPDADEGIATLRDDGVSVLFVSNKAITRRDQYRDKLNRLGIRCTSTDIITSATVTADYLARHRPTATSFVVGEEPLRDELREAGQTVTANPTDADVVVVSMDRAFDYGTLSDALDAMTEDTLFVGTNPDRTCPIADGEIPDAAGMIGAIEGVTGHSLDHLMGKPSETTMNAAKERLAVDASECLIVGDRLETDIVMGNRAGMTTVLVLTGVTDPQAVSASSVRPDYIIDTLGDINEVVD